MKLKLTFKGPNVIADTTRTHLISIGHAVGFDVEILKEELTVADCQRFFEMERTFNELTRGRLHVQLVP